MYPNTLRLSVKHDRTQPTLALLPIVGALNTHRYERRSQLVFVQEGVRIAAGEGLGDLVAEGWPSAEHVLGEIGQAGILVLACADCAKAHGVETSESAIIPQLEWVPTEDVRLPLHECGKPRARGRLVTVAAQQTEQRQFDDWVGKVTAGADRGEG